MRRRSKHGIDRQDWHNLAACFVKRGTDLPQSKLDEDKVRAIRANVKGETAKQLAERYGVHIRTIDKIRDRRSWAHVI